MSQLPRGIPAKATAWSDLIDELDRWGGAEGLATLWWRDDDAIAPSARLDRLVASAEHVPIALAVIPAVAEPELAIWLSQSSLSARRPSLAVLQHGWRHSNRSAGGKKSEFPAGRSSQDVRLDLAGGRVRLAQLFGSRALPILVPPWNRFDDSHLPLLAGCGIRAISRMYERSGVSSTPGVTEVNVHVDLVAWGGDRGFIGEKAALSAIVGHLRARRLGCARDEPTGILTHHLVQDEAADAFLQQLVAITGGHPAACWLDGFEIFAPVLVPV
jgi:hypothetical protein